MSLCLRRAPSVIVTAAFALAPHAALAYDWLQFGFDAQKSGNNTLERSLHRNNVGQLVLKWQVALPGNADGSAVVLDNVATAAGTTAVVYVNTREGHLLAYDTRNGNLLWSRQYPAGTCKINNGSSPCHMTTSPAIGPKRQFIYSYGLDGLVHKHQVADGVEIQNGQWPRVTTLKPYDEKHGGALAIATSGGKNYLYVVQGGYPGDRGDYQGHVTTIDLATASYKVFNVACSNLTIHIPHNSAQCSVVQNAVWARPGVVFHPALDRVFFATGNGVNTGVSGGSDWSESVLAINADGSGNAGKPVDSFTPVNHASLDAADADLGSTAPVILPSPAGSKITHLGMQGGKDGKLRLLNLANLSGQGVPGKTGGEIGAIINMPQGGLLLQQPAVWVNNADGSTWTFVATNSGAGIAALKVVVDGAGNPSLATQWQNTIAAGSPVVANNVLYATGDSVRAFDPVSGAQLWSTPRAGGSHFHSPIVVNGEVYVTDAANRLSAFARAGVGIGVDTHGASGTSSNTNAMLEPGESVSVDPSWTNRTAGTISLSGTATSLTGPAGATYSVSDPSAGYGSLAPGATGNCFTATGNCYRVSVSNPATRPALNWTVTLAETLSTGDPVSLRLHVGASFPDVPFTDSMYRPVETLLHNNVTYGFADGTFRPTATVPREISVIFVARGTVAPNGDLGIARSGLVPGPAGGSYACASGGTSLFSDLPPTNTGCKHVHALAALGVNVRFECTTPNGVCPTAGTTRATMAALIAGAAAGGDVNVPLVGSYNDTGSVRSYDCANTPGNSHFADVPPSHAACRYINYLWARGVVGGYADGTFRPASLVTRGHMAKFLSNGLGLSL